MLEDENLKVSVDEVASNEVPVGGVIARHLPQELKLKNSVLSISPSARAEPLFWLRISRALHWIRQGKD